MECLLTYLSMVTVPHIMVRLERMLDYRGVGLERFHCTYVYCVLVLQYICMFSVLIIIHLCVVCTYTYVHIMY